MEISGWRVLIGMEGRLGIKMPEIELLTLTQETLVSCDLFPPILRLKAITNRDEYAIFKLTLNSKKTFRIVSSRILEVGKTCCIHQAYYAFYIYGQHNTDEFTYFIECRYVTFSTLSNKCNAI